ncbi:MAG: hypothetical protein KC621_16470 [Myxococcales bacterium]|nr:hypothetical protein [Myxococcales bacterium]
MAMVRWAPTLLLAGCTTLSTLDGARTLSPGATQIAMAASLQEGANPVSATLIPLPQVELAARHGIAEDVDLGFRFYLLGMGADVRYRFLELHPLHVAVQPGLFTFALPLGGFQGSVEMRAPVTAEWELTDRWSVAAGTRVFLREQWNTVRLDGESGVASRLDSFLGGAGRFEYHVPKFTLGASVDVYGQPARSGGLAWSGGLDVQFRLSSARERNERWKREHPE